MMVSSSIQRGDVERCKSLGVAHFLLKPVRQSDLFDAIVGSMIEKLPYPGGGEETVFSKEPGSEASHDSDTAPDHASFKILLAEDNAVNRKLAEALLRKRGVAYKTVQDGQAALEILENERFDLILMDVQMPRMDGLEATAQIREKERGTGAHIPIVAMTAHVMIGDRERCLEAGMDDYVSKPMRAKELYAVIDTVMNMSSQVSSPERAPEMDLAKALDVVDGDEALLKELADDFIDQYPKQLEALAVDIDDQNWDQVEKRAHSLKGNVGVFGARTAYDLASDLEDRGRESRCEGTEVVLKRLKEELKKLRQYFSKPDWHQQ